MSATSNIDSATLDRLVRHAKRWAAFQQPDSRIDQMTDLRLAAEALEARENLLALVESLP